MCWNDNLHYLQSASVALKRPCVCALNANSSTVLFVTNDFMPSAAARPAVKLSNLPPVWLWLWTFSDIQTVAPVSCFQVLGFEVDSINSVQFSNHTGKTDDIFLSLLCLCVLCFSACGCVWVSQFPWCRDEVLYSVEAAGIVEAVLRPVGWQLSLSGFFFGGGGHLLHWLTPEQL